MLIYEKTHCCKNDNSSKINQFHVIIIRVYSYCPFLFGETK